MPGPHDLGGKDFGPIKRADHERSSWDDRVDALLKLLLAERHIRVDELRRGIESLSENDYMAFSYYEKWMAAMRGLIVEKDLLNDAEIEARIAELQKKAAA